MNKESLSDDMNNKQTINDQSLSKAETTESEPSYSLPESSLSESSLPESSMTKHTLPMSSLPERSRRQCKQNTPQLRFPEFNGKWVLKKLKHLTKINQGLQIPISDRYTESIENSYFYITNEFLKQSSDKRYFILNPPKSVICDANDILMTRTGNTGQVVTGVNGAFHNNFFKIKYESSQINKEYLVYFLRHSKTQNTILKLAGTSTIPDLNHGDFYRIKISLPSLPEQQKIASFLTAVDDYISSLEKEHTLLQQYKKGVMQRIFAPKGDPKRLRFKQADGSEFEEWEEKKLGEVGKTYNGLSGKTKDDFGSGAPFIQYMQIFSNSFIKIDECNKVYISNEESQNKVKYGDVFFTTSSETPLEIGTASVLLSEVEEMYLNSFCFGYRPNCLEQLVPMHSQYLFRSTQFRKEIIKLAQGSTRYNMSKVELMKIRIKIPCLEEQQKIADFLSKIDEQINGVKTQIEQAKEYKRGLLQKMFV